MIEIKLGLIGVGIGRSRAPELHRLAGKLCGAAVTYDLIEPAAGADRATLVRFQSYLRSLVTQVPTSCKHTPAPAWTGRGCGTGKKRSRSKNGISCCSSSCTRPPPGTAAAGS